MTDHEDIFSLRLARYGVPAVILIFYLTAALRIDYTPDTTFAALGHVIGLPPAEAGRAVSPLWSLILAGAVRAGLNPLISAKVLSLLFSSVVLLTSFLIAVEVLRDRFIAFAAVLGVAVESWMLQTAVSGHPFAFGMALVLGSIFFLQRNEYPVSAVLAGLASLIFWQAVVLVPLLAADAYLNSPPSRARLIRSAQVTGAALAVALLWPAVALARGEPVLAWMPPFVELAPPTAPGVLIYGTGIAACIAAGIVLLTKGARGRRVMLALLPGSGLVTLFTAVAIAGGIELWRMAIPLLFAGALFSLRVLLTEVDKPSVMYPIAFLLAGIIVVYNQMGMQSTVRDRMSEAAARNADIASVAVWLRSNVAHDTHIVADHPAVLAYYAGRPVNAAGTAGAFDLLVSAQAPGDDYVPVYRLPSPAETPEIHWSGYAVWKRR